MTLGRTSSGAIKIKTDAPGLRAVNCACCGCACGSARPINPESDPDFTKKLHGEDQSVTPFTSVSISCTVGSGPYSFTETISGNWVSVTGCGLFLGETRKKVLQTTACMYGSCGSYGGCGQSPNKLIGVTLVLLSTGCLYFSVREEVNFGFFRITGSSAKCNADGICQVQINGANYSTIMSQNDFGNPTFGSAIITFS